MFTLRAMTEADVAATTAIRNLPGARANTLAVPFESVERWRQQLAGPRQPSTDLVVCAGEVVIGQGMLRPERMARRAHCGTIGLHIHDGWVGKGAGTMLFGALVELADNWLGLRRLELGVYVDNAPAIALYRKFGFEVEATERADAFRDGAFVDAYLMARLRGPLPADLSAPPPRATPAPGKPFDLRAPEPDDVPGITALMNQPGVRYFTLRTPYCTPEEVSFLASSTDERRIVLALDGSVPVGVAMLTPGKNRRAHTAELDLLAVHDAWAGRGIGRALVAAMLDIADNWLNLKRVGVTAFADNAAAIALYEKFGFVREGVRRADAFRHGGFADAVPMGRVR
jgi:putative acetyltransferase